MAERPAVTRIIRADFNRLWRNPDPNAPRSAMGGVIVGERSNPGLSVGQAVKVLDEAANLPAMPGTVQRIERGRVFITVDWEAPIEPDPAGLWLVHSSG